MENNLTWLWLYSIEIEIQMEFQNAIFWFKKKTLFENNFESFLDLDDLRKNVYHKMYH